MSLGFQREQNRNVPKRPAVKTGINDFVSKPTKSIQSNTSTELVMAIANEKTHIVPEWVYTGTYVVLIISTVSSLWVIASGLWWIKYYVECNQGMRTCV